MGSYLDIIRREPSEQLTDSERSEGSEIRGVPASAEHHEGGFFRLIRFFRIPEELERWCPASIEPSDWQQAIENGHKFLAPRDMHSEALGRTARELFGLHPVLGRPAANYSRLSRLDDTGLSWLLRSRPVVALTKTTAAIRGATLGPVSDSLDDWGAT
jgi:hypothetical protein